MKKFFLMVLVALIAVGGYAKTTTKNPKGLYRLSEFIYEGGRTAPRASTNTNMRLTPWGCW